MNFVRYVGRTCTDPRYVTAVARRDPGVVDRFTERANLSFVIQRNGHAVTLQLDATHQDFLDLATLLYVADQANPRAMAEDYWTRDFNILFPVSNPELWSNFEDPLCRLLTFLTGDRFTFSWPKRGPLPKTTVHRLPLPPQNFDVVCLFSGGLDSLIGAYRLLEEGRRVLLVGHKSDRVASGVQKELALGLESLFPGKSSLVQCLANNARRESPMYPALGKLEDTHRVRSFLFLTIAISVARARRIRDVILPENGFIAINAPLQVSRRGTLSTRTAHPIFVGSFLEFLSASGLFSGTIRNPFLYDSKSDLVASIPPRIYRLALASVSCAHAGRNGAYRNCGYCVACLYRRAALIELGIDETDRYKHDVFAKLKSLSPRKQQDFRALVQFAETLEGTSAGQRTRLVLSHGFFPPDVGGTIGPRPSTNYSPWADMLKRWTDSFLAIVRRLSTRETSKILGLRVSRSRSAL